MGATDNGPEPGLAFSEAQQVTRSPLPLEGTVLVRVADRDKQAILGPARRFQALGSRILATGGTRAFLEASGVRADPVLKLHEGRPHLADAIKNGEVQLLVNTPAGQESAQDDSYRPRSGLGLS